MKKHAVSVQNELEEKACWKKKGKKLLLSNLQPELLCAETLLALIFVLPLN